MLDPGTRIGDWIIDSPLDEGGMGAVYRCHNFLSERITAAVKVMDRQRADVSRDRFVREVEALASLRHEAIVRILGFGEAPEHRAFFIAMEMVEGDPLAKRIQQGPWPWPGPREVFIKLSRGLAHAHGRGIAHRDIKPQNLMYGPDGSACIIDFGISAAEGRTSLTTEGMFLGTVTHMAPELFGHQAPDPIKADIYALGQVFYEVLTGHRAFTAQSALTAEQRMVYVMASKMNCEVLDPGPESPDALRALIREATQPDPSRRTPDLTAFVAALEAVPNVPGPGLPAFPPLPSPAPPRVTSGGGPKIVPPTALMATPPPSPLPGLVAAAAPALPEGAAPSPVPPPPVVPGPVTGSGRRADVGIPTRSGRKPGLPPAPERAPAATTAPPPSAQPAPIPEPAPVEPAAPAASGRGAVWGLGVGLLLGLPVGLGLLAYQLGWFDSPPPVPEPATATSGVNPITGTATSTGPVTALKSPPSTGTPSTTGATSASTSADAATAATGQTSKTSSTGSTPRDTTSSSKSTSGTDRPKRTTTTTETAPTAGDPNARMFLEIGLTGDVYSPPLMAMIQGRSSAFEACFQGAGAVGVSTTVVVRWALDAGQVTSPPRASGGSGALNGCLERRVKDIPFDPTQSGQAELELVYKPAG